MVISKVNHERRTRKRYNSEEKIAVVLAGFKHEESIDQICRNHGITPTTYYKWSKDFMEAGKHRLQGDTLRETNTSEVKTLKRENEELTHMFKELSLELRVLKKKQHFRKIGIKYRRYKQEYKNIYNKS